MQLVLSAKISMFYYVINYSLLGPGGACGVGGGFHTPSPTKCSMHAVAWDVAAKLKIMNWFSIKTSVLYILSPNALLPL